MTFVVPHHGFEPNCISSIYTCHVSHLRLCSHDNFSKLFSYLHHWLPAQDYSPILFLTLLLSILNIIFDNIVGNMAKEWISKQVTRKQSTPNLSKNEHFLPLDTNSSDDVITPNNSKSITFFFIFALISIHLQEFFYLILDTSYLPFPVFTLP